MGDKKRIREINSLFDQLDKHLDGCEGYMSKGDFNTASQQAMEALNKFGDRLNRDLPKLSHSHQKVARSRLEEKIEKEYVVNEAEAYLRQAKNDLNNGSARRTRIERKRGVDKLESIVELLRDLFGRLKGL